MCRGMRNPRRSKVRRYASLLIDINDNLSVAPGTTMSGKIGVTEINEILLNSMPNSWIKPAYVQVFDCKSINLKKLVNMFEHMEIVEYIYKGVV